MSRLEHVGKSLGGALGARNSDSGAMVGDSGVPEGQATPPVTSRGG